MTGTNIAPNEGMVFCRIKELIAEKERAEGRSITYRTITAETGLSSTTIVKLASFSGINRIDSSTIEILCDYFGCSVGDLLIRIPDNKAM